ncbi:hypothetical protein BJ165DRAFT_1531816 [Panaeolus papilionaceus]|nr:hypothetical protein BJ165DRAFT_1531816 [Panaeolus papilionaceus]
MTSSATPRASTRVSAGGTNRVLRSRTNVDPHHNSSSDTDSTHGVISDETGLGVVNASITPAKPEGYTLVLPDTPVVEFGKKRRLLDSHDESIDWSPSPPSKKHNSSSDEETTGVVDADTNASPPSPTLCSDYSGSDEERRNRTIGTNNAIYKILDAKDKHRAEQVLHSPVKPTQSANQEFQSVDGSDSPVPAHRSSSQLVNNSPNTNSGPRLKTIPAHSFTNPRNLGIYLPSSDPWSESPLAESLMDPDMIHDGLYDGLPAYPKLQLIYNSAPPNNDVLESDEEGNVIRHAMSIEAWVSFGISRQLCLKCITFTRNGLHSNPARDSPLMFSAMSYSSDGKAKFFKDTAPKTQFYAVDRDTNRPVLFWSLGVITSAFLSQPCNEPGRPRYRGLHAVLQRWERERLGAFFSMLFRNIHLNVQIDGNSAYVYQTRFQSTSGGQRPNLESYSSSLFQGNKIARFNIPTYRTPLKEATPPPYFNRGYAYTAQVPVYDARGRDFDPMCIDSSLENMPPFAGEVPEGSTAFIGYGAGTSVFNDNWKITFYIRYALRNAADDNLDDLDNGDPPSLEAPRVPGLAPPLERSQFGILQDPLPDNVVTPARHCHTAITSSDRIIVHNPALPLSTSHINTSSQIIDNSSTILLPGPPLPHLIIAAPALPLASGPAAPPVSAAKLVVIVFS